MARPRNKVRLSFDEDTVRFRVVSSYWCEDWRRVTEQSHLMVADLEELCRAFGESFHHWVYMGPPRHYDEEEGQRARNLLAECLSPSQRDEFTHTKSFTVISKSNRTYRIEFDRNYNVKLLNNNQKSILAYCAGPLEDVPIADMMLAQKLILENDEEKFLKIANKQGDPFEELRFRRPER